MTDRRICAHIGETRLNKRGLHFRDRAELEEIRPMRQGHIGLTLRPDGFIDQTETDAAGIPHTQADAPARTQDRSISLSAIAGSGRCMRP